MQAFLKSPPAVWIAMLCAAGLSAQFVAGKATRDALYLVNLNVTTLPAMVVVTAAASIGLVVLMSKRLQRLGPAVFMSRTLAVNAGMLVIEWLLLPAAPRLAAGMVYLQISGVGPLLGSGFWLMATERFDPHTARQRFGQIAAAGTFGGLVGGVLAERVGAGFGIAATLPLLAVGSLYCAWIIRRLALSNGPNLPGEAEGAASDVTRTVPSVGFDVLQKATYLQSLAVLVLLGTFGAVLVDYVLKTQAVIVFGTEEGLLRFFAFYYSAISLVTFVLQTSASRLALERLSLGTITGAPSIAVVAGGIGGLLWPGLTSIVLARGAESVGRGAFFRSAYELFYTPIPPAEKRAAKPLIDVGIDRVGEALGGGAIQLALLLIPATANTVILSVAILSACLVLFTALRLERSYAEAVERWLIDLGRRMLPNPLRFVDWTTKSVATKVEMRLSGVAPVGPNPLNADPSGASLLELRSTDPAVVKAALQRCESPSGALVACTIPLLAWDEVSEDVVLLLRRAADLHVGQMVDALLDSRHPVVVRRRLARTLSACTSQRAGDGLLLGLNDPVFRVRFRCAQSLAEMMKRGALRPIETVTVYSVVLRELQVQPERTDRAASRDARRLQPDDALEHVFRLLSLVHGESTLVAYRALQSGDENIRGTALEYLQATLPPSIGLQLLWPFLD
jgi:hypothetical protein